MSNLGEQVGKLEQALASSREQVDHYVARMREWRDRHIQLSAENERLKEKLLGYEQAGRGSTLDRVGATPMLRYLWRLFFPERVTPIDISANFLHGEIMAEYERRLCSVNDGVVKSARDQYLLDCGVVCNLCAQKEYYHFIGDPYPSPVWDGWVHNIRTRDGNAVAVRCEASALHEAFTTEEDK